MSQAGSTGAAAGSAPALLKQRYEVGERQPDTPFFFVYRGRDIQTGGPVTISVLRPDFASDEVFSSRLITEIQGTIRLQHSNLARSMECWRERGTVVIISEWVRGIHLRERISRVAPFPIAVAVDIGLAMVEALHYAHDSGFTHGDLRPDNVIITPEGHVKVRELGVGSALATSSRIQASALPQSAGYLAPEVVQGKPADARADVYAIGCLLFEMLACQTPYAGDTPLAVALNHVNQPVPSVKSANPAVPPAVDGLVQRCMQKDARARYADAESLLGDLHRIRQALRNDEPLSWSPLPSPQPVEVPEVVSKPAAARTHPASPRNSGRGSQHRRAEAVDTGPSGWLLLGLGLVTILVVVAFFGLGIYLTRSPGEATVPQELVGMSQEEALESLNRLELKSEFRQEFNDRIEQGKVFRSDPRGGLEVKAGRTVTLFVSLGPEPVPVPSVTGKDQGIARRELEALGFLVDTHKGEFSEVIPKGEVISQNPPAEAKARRKSTVLLTVSKGPEPVPEAQPVEVVPAGSESGDPGVTPDSPGTTYLEPRQFEVKVSLLPTAVGPQHTKVEIENEDGAREVQYEQEHRPGETITPVVSVLGRPGRCRVRVYVNDRLVRDEAR